jgi:hypothetical protein
VPVRVGHAIGNYNHTFFIIIYSFNFCYSPTVKWMSCTDGLGYTDAVPGGVQGQVRLFVIRASHSGSQTPGKLFEYMPPGWNISDPLASIAWSGAEHKKRNYEVSEQFIYTSNFSF